MLQWGPQPCRRLECVSLCVCAWMSANKVGMGVPLVYSEYNSGLYPFFVGNNDDPFASAFIVHTIPSLQPYNVRVHAHGAMLAPCWLQ